MVCHRCENNASKFGFHKGFQRYRCRFCGGTFVDAPRKPLDSLKIDPQKAYLIIKLLCEGNGVRACERLVGVNRRTVLNVLATSGQKCNELLNAKLKNLHVTEVQVDELFSFVRTLPANTDPENHLEGEQWIFLAVERNSKLILNWYVGRRTKITSQEFLRVLKSRLDGQRFQLTTDCFAPYCSYLGTVFKVFRERIDYGTEFKKFATLEENKDKARRFDPVVCVKIKRQARIGNPRFDRITTNHAERNNLNIRLFNRRFTRKTLGYSKTLRNHSYSVVLQVAYLNFCRVHHSLDGQTPAMAQGITDHVWKVEELLKSL